MLGLKEIAQIFYVKYKNTVKLEMIRDFCFLMIW